MLVAFFSLFTGMFVEKTIDYIIAIDTNGPDKKPNVVEPEQKYKNIVQPIVRIEFSNKDASCISGFFKELASVLKTDPGFIVTTGQFRDFNIMSGMLNFSSSDIKDTYPNLGNTIDNTIIKVIGNYDVKLTNEKRQELISILEAISWSVTQ
jgi:hypothetical protein